MTAHANRASALTRYHSISFYKHVWNMLSLFFPHIFDYTRVCPYLNDCLINWYDRTDRFSQLTLHPITGIDAALKRSGNHPSKLMPGRNHLLITRGIETIRPRFNRESSCTRAEAGIE